jgi:hypothetical protein
MKIEVQKGDCSKCPFFVSDSREGWSCNHPKSSRETIVSIIPNKEQGYYEFKSDNCPAKDIEVTFV